MKTKSGAKKRFKITSTGLIKSAQAGKRHNMRKRQNRTIRNQRGMAVLPYCEIRRAAAYFPYGSCGI